MFKSDALGKANATTTVAYSASGMVGMTSNHGWQATGSEVANRFDSKSTTVQRSSLIVNVTTPTGPRNSAVNRYFEALEEDLESQFDTPKPAKLQDFA